ncbi:TonB family protein [uncultured Martelella sp.]|uniref:TonB family protein n=1 Tax=uncultured Martelella sp. TaxID=392331 RepID=UPI0029C9669E|nr:TonB family protein [uncultured Martelella sp.]
MFAMGLPGGIRDAEPVEPVSSSPAAGRAPEVELDSRKPADLDTVVSELMAAAGAKKDDAGASSADDGPELPEEEVDLGSVTLPRISGAGEKPSAGTRLPLSALASLLVHVTAFAMAMHVAEVLPDAPEEEGSTVVNVVMLGNGDVDAAASGSEEVQPTEVEAEPVPVEQAVAPEAETLAPEAAEPPPPSETPVEQTPPVETLSAPTPVPEEAVAPPAEVAEAVPAESPEPAPVAALSSPEPDVLAVAPTDAAAPDAVAPARPTVPETVAPPETVEATPPDAETTPLVAEATPTETIKAQEDDPELAYDIAPPVPQRSPWENEPLPEDQVATRQAQAERQRQQTRQRQTAQRQSAGSGGQSAQDARRGSVSGNSETGSSQAAEARRGSSGDGAAAMANYAGKVGARLRRAVASDRHYRGLGPLRATVVVHVTLNRSGHIASVSMARSSGNGSVDSIVLQRARSAGPFGAFPSSYAGASHTFRLPINLNLRR